LACRQRLVGRPTIRRPLAQVVAAGSFEEQRARLVDAVADVGSWMDRAIAQAGGCFRAE
jgi:hypothetical protein